MISLKSLTACSWAGPAQPPGPTPWLIPLLSAAPRRGAALWPLTGERINGAKVVQIKAECGEWSKGHRWRPGGGEGVSGASGCYQSPLTPSRCPAASDLRSLLAASRHQVVKTSGSMEARRGHTSGRTGNDLYEEIQDARDFNVHLLITGGKQKHTFEVLYEKISIQKAKLII